MAHKDLNVCLRDVSNVRTTSHSPSNYNHALKRFATSPASRHPNDLSKPPARISPSRKTPMKHPIQLTPKRLPSPECLKEYKTKRLKITESPLMHPEVTDRDQTGSSTTMVFQTSPTKAIFSNERKIGGDGSLGRIRSRFSNGLLSPQRRIVPAPKQKALHPEEKELEAKNLFEKLEEAEKLERSHSGLTCDLYKGNDDGAKDAKAAKSVQCSKKSVKFELPTENTREKILEELHEVGKLLEEAFKRHRELELRLAKFEHQDN